MTNAHKLIIAMDLGTTGIKVGLFDADGTMHGRSSREQELHFPAPGFVEQSPQHTWELIIECVHELMSNRDKEEVEAIVLSLQRGTVIPLDSDGHPLTNFLVWMDERGLEHVQSTRQAISSADYHAITGHPIIPITGLSKILWLMHDRPDLWEKTYRIGNQQTLFLQWLGADQFILDRSLGSFLFPMDIRTKTWSSEIASLLGIDLEVLPALVDSTISVGVLSDQAAMQLGLKPGISLIAGGGDGQCAGAGSGVVSPGLVMVNIGTSAGIQTYLDEARFDPAAVLNCAAHIVPEGWELEGHTQASGSVFKWFRDEFGQPEKGIAIEKNLDPYDLLVEEAMKSSPGAKGLVFLPTFYGSTAPVVDSRARGVLLGLTQSHRREDVIRALLEGISLEIRWMLDAVEGMQIPVEEIRLAGGGSLNPKLNQIHADIFRRPVRTIANPDASLVGAAICAAVGLGEFSSIQEAAASFVQTSEMLEPSEESAEAYESAYKHYRKLFTTLSAEELFRRPR